ncbi:UDP-N-acetylglucosamine--N-acetylmuramyl-(pentapeptide) pyrophosphoryl-undecaprenol N-acetylglucosamine transferase [Candidatus Ecksteinia adelgidicola]|nr:UDP-N-acetylglucosamine--N-acetylmuramyl-(pentapeptide) pyrophosphoryl-undecaprenol N-acetylglucosamine transferase [Candidatus Ecksteinia adelgidicola]
MNKNFKRIIIMAGGTAGHVFPGLVIADQLIELGWKVRWLGTADHIESYLVPKHDIEIDFISISSLRGKKLKNQICVLLYACKAVIQAKKIIQQFKPNIVLGMGGYVSGPAALGAWLCGIPIVLHEQNSVAGLTNRWLSRFSNIILQAYPGTFKNAKVVGNPLRRNIIKISEPNERLRQRKGCIRVLVMGGSQGAQIFNQILPEVLTRLKDKITVWHQVGKGALSSVFKNYKKLGKMPYKITQFIDNIAIAYAWADVVICRSGALTVSEISAVGLPAIFVPFKHKDNQQYWNAVPLENIGAAKIIQQEEFNAKIVSDILLNWNRSILFDMANKARSIVINDATERVVTALIQTSK